MAIDLFWARKKNFLFYLLIFLGAMCLYFFTALRGFGWQDSGEFQYRIISGDYRWCQGIARAHPLYFFGAVLWSKLFPAGQIAFAANTFSGLGMASALLLLAAIARRLTQNRFAALFSVVLLAFFQMAWRMSTTAEVYTWSVTFLLAARAAGQMPSDWEIFRRLAPRKAAGRFWRGPLGSSSSPPSAATSITLIC